MAKVSFKKDVEIRIPDSVYEYAKRIIKSESEDDEQ